MRLFSCLHLCTFWILFFNLSSTMTFGNDLRHNTFAETSVTPQQHAPVIRHLTHHVLHIVYLLDCSHVVPSRGPHNPRWEYWELPMYIFGYGTLASATTKFTSILYVPMGCGEPRSDASVAMARWNAMSVFDRFVCGNRFHF